jgi:hypothetical protein
MGADPPTLPDTDRQVLELAVRTDIGPGLMANLIRELGMTEPAYYRRLLRILETAAAAAAYPVQVRLLKEAMIRRTSRAGRI